MIDRNSPPPDLPRAHRITSARPPRRDWRSRLCGAWAAVMLLMTAAESLARSALGTSPVAYWTRFAGRALRDAYETAPPTWWCLWCEAHTPDGALCPECSAPRCGRCLRCVDQPAHDVGRAAWGAR